MRCQVKDCEERAEMHYKGKQVCMKHFNQKKHGI